MRIQNERRNLPFECLRTAQRKGTSAKKRHEGAQFSSKHLTWAETRLNANTFRLSLFRINRHNKHIHPHTNTCYRVRHQSTRSHPLSVSLFLRHTAIFSLDCRKICEKNCARYLLFISRAKQISYSRRFADGLAAMVATETDARTPGCSSRSKWRWFGAFWQTTRWSKAGWFRRPRGRSV